MARLDRIKEEVGWLKVVFGVLVAVDASLVGWLAQNYEGSSITLSVGAITAIVVITVVVAQINRVAYSRIRELEDT